MMKPETFDGRVINVQQIFSEGINNLHKQILNLHHGYDKYGTPIRETVMEGVFDVALESSEGLRKTFEWYKENLEEILRSRELVL